MTSYYASDPSIAALAAGFLDSTLPKAEWTHAAHFATTLWLLRHQPERNLEYDLPGLIRAYNAAVGGVNDDHAGYHETITQASIRAARRFLADRSADAPLHAIVDALMVGILGQPDWLLAYWSRERLFSVEARRGWVAPDLEALPF